MNEITVALKVGKIRLVCGLCKKFVAHMTLEEISEAADRPWEKGLLECTDHPGEMPMPDFSATDLKVTQEAKEI